MEFCIAQGDIDKQRTDCIVLGVYAGGKLSTSAETINQASGKHLSKVLEQGDLSDTLGDTLLLAPVPKISAKRVMLVSLGEEKSITEASYRQAVAAAVKAVSKTRTQHALICLPDAAKKLRSAAWRVRQAVLVAAEAAYRFDQFKTKAKKENDQPGLEHIAIHQSAAREDKHVARALTEGCAIVAGMTLSRDLGNLPANICTPGYLAHQAVLLSQEFPIQTEVLDRSAMEKLGMNAFLAVAKGAHQPPKLIVMQYQGAKKGQPIVLVGKGVTFDTGGISLKPSADMDEMKYDMCGAASVLGTLKTVAMLKLPINVVGIIPATENMPGGSATRPGDIVTSMSGQTIEILNTDAEGRLILCDALTYAEKFSPQLVIDIATLTGACVVALGTQAHGLYANEDALAEELLTAGQEAWDRGWHMPLWEEYQEQLKSPFADMGNIGGRWAGSVTAACFLARFTKQYTWAHLDVAGTAWIQGKDKTSTGRPVPLLTHFLLSRAGFNVS